MIFVLVGRATPIKNFFSLPNLPPPSNMLVRSLILLAFFLVGLGIGYASFHDDDSPPNGANQKQHEQKPSSTRRTEPPAPITPNPPTSNSAFCTREESIATMSCFDDCAAGLGPYNTCIGSCHWSFDCSHECEKECFTPDCDRVCEDFLSCHTEGGVSHENCDLEGCIAKMGDCGKGGSSGGSTAVDCGQACMDYATCIRASPAGAAGQSTCRSKYNAGNNCIDDTGNCGLPCD